MHNVMYVLYILFNIQCYNAPHTHKTVYSNNLISQECNLTDGPNGKVWFIHTAKTDVCRLCIALSRSLGRGLETSKSNALLEIRV
jgi:hypothetical protein